MIELARQYGRYRPPTPEAIIPMETRPIMH